MEILILRLKEVDNNYLAKNLISILFFFLFIDSVNKSEDPWGFEDNEISGVKINMFIKGINITLFSDDEDRDCIKTDLLAVYIDDMAVKYDSISRIIELKFLNFQIDNQLYTSGKYDFPVVLSPQKTCIKSTSTELPSVFQPMDIFNHKMFDLMQTPVCTIQITLYKDDDGSSSFSLEEVYCNIQPMRSYIEDKYINMLLEFAVENLPENLVYAQDDYSIVVREQCEPGQVLIPKHVLIQSLHLAEPFKLRHVRIDALSVLLSVHTCMRYISLFFYINYFYFFFYILQNVYCIRS